MVRGIERRPIFLDDADRLDLVQRLELLIPDEGFTCFGWALMPNHFHLVIRSGPSSVSRLMARLATGYATRFNRKYDRVGHVFQNRFRSDLITSGAHLRALLRYVHQNPVRGGIVGSLEELEGYPWTGHAALIGCRSRRFLAVDEVLGWFDEDPAAARTALKEWMQDREPRWADGWELDRLLAWVCAQIGSSEDDVRRGRRTRIAISARGLTAYFASAKLGLSGTEIAGALALDSGSTSRAIRRGQAEARRRGLAFPRWEY
jgi:REP element-mobilizing transposase RayT